MSKKVKVLGSAPSPDITERKQVEEALRESEERYRLIAENTSDIIALTTFGLHPVIIYESPSVKALGYEPEELLGKPAFDFVHPDDRKRLFSLLKQYVTAKVKKLLTGREPYITERIEYRFRDKTGNWHDLQTTANLVGNQMLFVSKDITERKQAEEALRGGEKNYELLFQSMLDGLLVFDAETVKVVLANQAAAELYGFDSAEEAIGVNPLDFVAPDDRERAIRIIVEDMFEKDLHQVNEFRTMSKDGREIWISAVGARTAYQGRLAGLISLRDITEPKRTEETLRESERKYKALFENLNDAAFLADVETGRILDTNKQGELLLGRTREEIIGIHQSKLHPAGMANEYRQRFLAHAQKGRAADYDGEVIRKDGSIVLVSISASPVNIGGKGLVLGLFRDITERKCAEEALQESEERYRALLELGAEVGEAVAMLQDTEQGEGIYTFVNDEWPRITGYSREELLSMSFLDLTPPKHREASLERHQRKMRGESVPGLFELSIIRKDGTEVPIELTSAYTTYKGERANVVYIRDITERKRMEQDLKKRIKELECLYSVAYIAERPGITLDELCQEVVNLLPAGWQYPEITCARATLGHKEFKTDNFKITEWKQSADINVKGQKEGAIEVYYLEERPEIDEGSFLKEERLLIGVIAERLGRITERKCAEEALQESEERYRALLELGGEVGEAVVMLQDTERGNGIQIFVSDEWPRITGYPRRELLGMSFFDLVHPKRREASLERHYRKMRGEVMPGLFDLSIVNKDGTEVPIELTSAYTMYKGERANVLYIRDITERKRMERELQERNEQLDVQNEELQSQSEELMTQQQELIEKTGEVERANQLKSEFLASMSHELRTPLNVIIGFSELMRDGVPGEINDEQRQCLDDILAGGQHLLNLINDILDLSKVEAGKMEFKLESLNLVDVINDTVQTIKLMLDDKGHKLRVSVEEGLPQVRADRGRLKQVFLNLLSNATKFTPPGGKLGIEVSRQGDWCQASVVDNGMGIKEEDQEKIFEVFTQVEALPDGNKRGTGLGLALTRQFVEVMGGRIWVESEYGKGSRFTFTLPLAGEGEPYLEEEREELEVGLPEVKEPSTKPGQKLVLLVDDDHRTRRLVSAWLKAEGCAIAEASTGDEGIRKAKELAPALVILDILMPDKDGWQVLQALKSMPETRDIPVVITSVIEEKELGFRLGAVDYFVKPVDRKRFQKRIAELGIARREKVLVVDDNPADVRLVASILEAENIRALCSYGGEEGVRMAKENEPSLIVLDILMPDLDGFEVIERLRQDEKTKNIPIIILTAKELAEEELKKLWQTKAIIMKATFRREDFVSEVKKVVSLGGE